jgi:hypothetical protein
VEEGLQRAGRERGREGRREEKRRRRDPEKGSSATGAPTTGSARGGADGATLIGSAWERRSGRILGKLPVRLSPRRRTKER